MVSQSSSLFSTCNLNDIGFSPSQQIKFDSMSLNSIYSGYHCVDVNSLMSSQNYGSFLVNIPGTSSDFVFHPISIEYSDSTEWRYYGELDTCSVDDIGSLHLLRYGNDIFGQIVVNDDIYMLEDFGSGKNVLFKIDNNIFSEYNCGNLDSLGSDTSETGSNLFRSSPNAGCIGVNGGCHVDVLVLYTSNALEVGHPENSSRLFIDQVNKAASRSDAEVRFKLKATELWAGFNEGVDHNETLGDLRSSGINGYVRSRRDFHEADLVILLTDGNWNFASNGFNVTILGTSYLNRFADGPSYGFAIVELDAGGGSYTFAHEVGHSFGCKHRDDLRGGAFTPEARAHLMSIGIFNKRRSTIMEGNAMFSPRVLRFSNPDKEYCKEQTGVNGQSENYAQLSQQSCIVANYRGVAPPMCLIVTGPSRGNNNGLYTWCASVDNCANVLWVKWEFSLDGFNYSTISSNSLCITKSLPFNRGIWLKVTAKCSDGQIKTVWQYVWNEDEMGPCDPIPLVQSEQKKEVAFESFAKEIINWTLQPNPASDELVIRSNTIGNCVLIIRGCDGKELMTKAIGNGYGENLNAVDISHLPNGYYLITLSTNGISDTKSFVKLSH